MRWSTNAHVLTAFAFLVQVTLASEPDISLHQQRTILESKAKIQSTECFQHGYLQNVDDDGNLLFRVAKLPSATACLEQVTLDTAMTVQMVKSIWGLFDANYAFFDYATNAPDSSPLNNPLDWAIYNGSSGGQVNFRNQFGELIERVERDGANLFTTLEMCDIIARARDSHTDNPLTFVNNAVLQGTGLALLDMNEIDELKQIGPGSLPNRYLSLEEVNGDVSMIQVYPASGRKDVIKRIDGVDAVGFMEELVSNTALRVVSSYKSSGSRMQEFLRNLREDPPYVFQTVGVFDFRNLPECMNVEFEDGSTTRWCFAVYVPGNLANKTVEEIIDIANTIPKDGPYEIFEEAINEAVGSRLVPDFPLEESDGQVPGDEAPPVDVGSSSTGSRQSQQQPADALNWNFFVTTDKSLINDYDTDVLFALTSVGDATVLKFESFMLSNMTQIASFCKQLYDFGETTGSTRLIIDLTNNGGGETAQAYAMTQCLYPSISFQELSIPYTKRISEVGQLNENLLNAANDVFDALDTFDLAEVLNADINATIAMLKTVRNIHKGLVVLSTGYSNQNEYKRDVTTISLMLEEIMRERHVRSSFEPLLRNLMKNTWLDTVEDSNNPASFGSASFTTVIQGGNSVKIATDFARLGPQNYVTFQAALKGRTSPFKSYVLMGNGLGGSSSALFEFGTLQYSHLNPDAIPAIGVSYGCSGNKETCPINQYQGGSVNRGSNENMKMYYAVGKGLALGELVATLLKIDDSNPDTTSIGDKYISALNQYSLSVPTPPMTATSAYTDFDFAFLSAMTKIAGDDSIPAEYFDIPPKEYVPYWPPWHRLNDLYATDAILPVYQAIANGSY